MSLLAGLTAACSGDATRFGIPAFTGSTANQKAIIGGTDQPMPAALPAMVSAPVQRADLPPPMASAQQDTMAPPTDRAVIAASEPQPLARPVAAQAVAVASKAGWDASNGQVVVLGPGETLASVSRRYGVPVKELALANNITNPSAIGPGSRIVIPTFGGAGDARAKVAAAPSTLEKKVAVAETATQLGGLHTVTPGQTVDQIARLYNVSPVEIAALNHLGAQDTLRTGQQIKIPGHHPASTVALRPEPARKPETSSGEDADGAQPIAANRAGPAPDGGTKGGAKPSGDPATTASLTPAATGVADATQEMAATPASQPQAYAPPAGEKATAVAASASGSDVVTADAPSANGTSFRWPVRGRIIGSFGSAAGGERNDGINLAVPEGTSIKAAEAGTVIYAGNELEGYGQLVLIRHADGWVSAYAHNSQILVKRGDTVRRGQIISRAGNSGNVSAPQLHFELRKGSKPVNPLDYLQG